MVHVDVGRRLRLEVNEVDGTALSDGVRDKKKEWGPAKGEYLIPLNYEARPSRHFMDQSTSFSKLREKPPPRLMAHLARLLLYTQTPTIDMFFSLFLFWFHLNFLEF